MLLPQRVARNPIKRETNIRYYRLYLDEFREYRSNWYQRIAEHYSGGTLLEVDAGLAELGTHLARLNPALGLVALEARPEFLDEAAKNEAKSGLGKCRWIQGEPAPLPFGQDSFSGVVSSGALRNWGDPGLVIQEMLRVTVQGGHVFILDLRRDLNEWIAELVIRDWQSRGSPMAQWFLEYFINSWRTAYTKEEVQGILANAGVDSSRLEDDDPITQMVHIPV